jgi:hypothetical protein
MSLRTPLAGLCLGIWAAALPSVGEATVYFENAGTTAGWSKVYAQQIGKVSQVTSPVYRGTTALAFEQTFNDVLTGYHSETIVDTIQSNGQDRYYGKVLRLPSNWAFNDTNITFQQWSPENPEGPWMLNWVGLNNRMYIQAKPSGGSVDIGAITAGVWTRVVHRLYLRSTGGVQQYWVNGTQTLNRTNISSFEVPGTTLRWSNGMYCTQWRTSVPTTQYRIFHQDHFRVASSYAEAEPASWGGSTSSVQLFQGCNYGGWSASFPVGDYTMADIQARGGVNDDASSIRVPAGRTVTLYKGNNFSGASVTLTSDDSCLTDKSFNDAVSSMRVR